MHCEAVHFFGGVMRIAAYQFMGGIDLERNIAICRRAAELAQAQDALCLVLPEATMYLRAKESDKVVTQDLQGFFVRHLQDLSVEFELTIVAGMFTPSQDGRAYNTLVVVQKGAIINFYHKLHLYDAFASLESERIAQGEALPPVFPLADFKIGLMTCYDLRFPEVARSLAERGADVILLPAAWVDGEEKLQHWRILSQARALENGVYLLAVDMCGAGRVGHSLFVDPMGRVYCELDNQEGLLLGEIKNDLLQNIRKRLPLLSQRRFKISADF